MMTHSRSWSRALIWALVELRQVIGQPKVPPWLAPRGKVFKIIDNSGQLVPTFLSKYWHNSFFVLYTMLMCSNSIFNLLKRIRDSSFLFSSKMLVLVFLFLPSLNLGTQIDQLLHSPKETATKRAGGMVGQRLKKVGG